MQLVQTWIAGWYFAVSAEIAGIVGYNILSMACILCSSALRVHVLHTYGNMDMVSARISLILDPRAMLFSFHIGLSLVSATSTVACAVLKILGLDPSSVMFVFPRAVHFGSMMMFARLILVP